MTNCDHCGADIPFAAKRVEDSGLTFCTEDCHGLAVALAECIVPQDATEGRAREIHQANCPRCGGSGPTDVRASYRLWSMLFVTEYSTYYRICCRPCGLRAQLWSMLYCLLFGWWSGFGVLATPAWIIYNITGAVKGPDPTRPSADLKRTVRMRLLADIAPPVTPGSAISVSEVAHEYLYVRATKCECGRRGKLQVKLQALMEGPTGPVDVLTAVCGTCQRESRFYFDVTKVFERYKTARDAAGPAQP